jgi:hypothetical protein
LPQTNMLTTLESVFSSSQLALLGWALLLVEVFHAYAHANVLLRVQPPTLEQLKGRRYYFVFDMATPLMAYCLHESWGPLVLVHALAHMYYVYAWNEGYYAVRIRDWSVREYRGPRFTVDFALTCYDIAVHVLTAHALFRLLVVRGL